MACSGNSFSVSKQSLAGWGAEGVFQAFCSQSEAAGVFGQVETATLPGAGCVFLCVQRSGWGAGGLLMLVLERDTEGACVCIT